MQPGEQAWPDVPWWLKVVPSTDPQIQQMIIDELNRRTAVNTIVRHLEAWREEMDRLDRARRLATLPPFSDAQGQAFEGYAAVRSVSGVSERRVTRLP